MELELKQIVLSVELEANGVLREALPRVIVPQVITALKNKPYSTKSLVALQVNGLQLVLQMPLQDVLTALLVNGAEKDLTPRLLTRTDARLLTISAQLEPQDLSLVLLENSSTPLQLATLAQLALPVSIAQE